MKKHTFEYTVVQTIPSRVIQFVSDA